MNTIDVSKYDRIMLVGNNGSGKSYLSEKLADITNLPITHLDVHYWRPNWEQPTIEEWSAQQKEFVAPDKWIIDGNHNSTMEIRMARAELLIYLDINRLTCMHGAWKRKRQKRSDMPDFLEEKYDLETIKFILSIWSSSPKRKALVMGIIEKYPDMDLLIIKSRKQMNSLIKAWQEQNK